MIVPWHSMCDSSDLPLTLLKFLPCGLLFIDWPSALNVCLIEAHGPRLCISKETFHSVMISSMSMRVMQMCRCVGKYILERESMNGMADDNGSQECHWGVDWHCRSQRNPIYTRECSSAMMAHHNHTKGSTQWFHHHSIYIYVKMSQSYPHFFWHSTSWSHPLILTLTHLHDFPNCTSLCTPCIMLWVMTVSCSLLWNIKQWCQRLDTHTRQSLTPIFICHKVFV